MTYRYEYDEDECESIDVLNDIVNKNINNMYVLYRVRAALKNYPLQEALELYMKIENILHQPIQYNLPGMEPRLTFPAYISENEKKLKTCLTGYRERLNEDYREKMSLMDKTESLEKELARVKGENDNLRGIKTVFLYYSIIIFLSLVYNMFTCQTITDAIDITVKYDGFICVFICSLCAVIFIIKWLWDLK